MSESGQYDSEGPRLERLERNMPQTSPTRATALTWELEFDEAVVDVDAADFTLDGPVGVTLTPTVGSSGDTVTVAVSGGNLATYEGTVTLGFAADSDIADAHGNALVAEIPTDGENTYVLDRTGPTLTVSAPSKVNGPFTATYTFSEPVSGFTQADATSIHTNIGSVSDFEAVSTQVYTLEIVPGQSGIVRMGAVAGAATDAAGNDTLSGSASTIYDDAYPQLTISGIPAVTNAPVRAAFTFSEAVTGFTAEDLVVVNATISQFTGTGAAYTARVIPTAEGTFSVSVAEDVALDEDGLGNFPAQASSRYDISRPGVSLAGFFPWRNGTTEAATSFGVTFNFTESVPGFNLQLSSGNTNTLNPIVILNNLKLIGFAGSNSNRINVFPPQEGPYSIEIGAGDSGRCGRQREPGFPCRGGA